MAARDLTQGSIPYLLVRLALPTFASFALQSLYQLVDLYFVGMLGGAAIAGMSIALNTFFLALALGMTFGIGALAVMSQAYGRGERARMATLLQQALAMAIACGVVLWGVGLAAAGPFVAFFTDDPAVWREGTAFFRVHVATFVTQLLLMVLSFSFRAVGDFTTPMVLMGTGVLANLALDPLLIFGWGPVPALGIRGAATATVLSQVLALALALRLLVRPAAGLLTLRRPFVLEPAVMARMLRIGLPSGVQFLLFVVTLLITYRVLRPFGSEAIAAVGVGFRIIETGVLPVISLGAAVGSLVGQNYGAGRLDRVRATVAWGVAYAVLVTAAEYALLAWRPRLWVGVFTDDPAVVALGAQYLSVVGLVLLALGQIHPVVSLGVGLGRTLLPLAAQVVRVVTLIAALAVLVGPLDWGVPGVFWSRVISQGPELAFLYGVLVFWWRGVLREPQATPAREARPTPDTGW